MRVLRPDELPFFDRGGGARTTPLVTAAIGGTSYLNGVTAFDGGAAIAHHLHNVAESVMVIEGDAIVDIDGRRTALRAHDVTFVPANIPHHFENASGTAPMRIFWTYGSLDATRTLVANGRSARVDDESRTVRAEPMASEVTRFSVRPGREQEYLDAITDSLADIQHASGARTLKVERCIGSSDFILTVLWESATDALAFRLSPSAGLLQERLDPLLSSTTVSELRTTAFIGF